MKISVLIKVLVTLLIIPAMLYLARVGIADFLVLSPRAYVDSIQSGRVRLDPAELFRAKEKLENARSWDAANPVVHEYLGQIAYMRASLFSSSPTLQEFFLRDAIVNFDRATAVRPNSAILWADRMTIGSRYIEVSAVLGSGDKIAKVELPIIVAALRRAALLGPWEPSVLRQLVQVGKLRYSELSPSERVVVDGAVGRAKQLNLSI